MGAAENRYSEYLASERAAARLYRALAELTDGERRSALLELASIEDRHAAHWEGLLDDAGQAVPSDDGTLEPADEEIIRRARQLSLDDVLPELEQAERDAQSLYNDEPAALPTMASDERRHEQVLRRLQSAPRRPRTPAEVRAALSRGESWHRSDHSGSLRAAVFGASDGLVSNTALVMGFAGSGTSSSTVLFAGFAGLLAGAFSMGAGEYVSVASQRDVFRRELALEARELRENPKEEQHELELLYRAKGLDRETAHQAAESIMSDPDVALDTLAREELGLDPDELGSPLKVAGSSFGAFTIGAIVPVLPYLVWTGATALWLSVCLASLALLTVGGLVGWVSGLGVIRSALRQFVVGGGAAAVTYVLGRLVGTGLG